MEDGKLPFTEHLEELRKRLVISAIAVGVGFLASYGFAEQLYMLLAQPIKAVMQDDNSFIFTSLTEAFFTYLKLALFSGIVLWEESKRLIDSKKDFLKSTLEIGFEIFSQGIKTCPEPAN